MNIRMAIAKNIRVADEKAGYDAACKRLLSEKIILVWIMKNCLDEYRDCDVEQIPDDFCPTWNRVYKFRNCRNVLERNKITISGRAFPGSA